MYCKKIRVGWDPGGAAKRWKEIAGEKGGQGSFLGRTKENGQVCRAHHSQDAALAYAAMMASRRFGVIAFLAEPCTSTLPVPQKNDLVQALSIRPP